MTRRAALTAALLLAAAACEEQPTAPQRHPTDAGPSFAAAAETGPPSRSFEPESRDTRATGVFTRPEVDDLPRLVCSAESIDRRFDGYLESHLDGTLLDATLQLPASTVPAPYPLVVLMHGWAGSKSGDSGMADDLLAEGYAVLRYSTRGFGESWGQVNLADIAVEGRDLQSMITRVAAQPACAINADAVAVTGASYGGAHSWMGALEPAFRLTPESPAVRIRTVVPIAAWTDLVFSLLPNGRPRNSLDGLGALKFSYVNALFFSGQREFPDGPEPWYDNYPTYLRAWHGSLTATEPPANPFAQQITDGLAGYRSIWWQQRFWASAAGNKLPIFQIHGFTDDLFTTEEPKRMLLALKGIDPFYPIASYFGDVGHPRARNRPTEVDHVLGLIRNWLAYYLKGQGTQPPHVIYAAVTNTADFDPASVVQVNSWEQLATGVLTHKFSGSAVILNPGTGAPGGPFSDPVLEVGLIAAGELSPFPGNPPESNVIDPTAATYRVPVATLSGGSAILIAGQPTVSIWATTTSPRVQFNVRLYDVAPSGTRQLITRGTYTVDNGIGVSAPGELKFVIPTAGNFWRVAADHTLQLEITNVDFPYLSPSQVPSATTITKVELALPTR